MKVHAELALFHILFVHFYFTALDPQGGRYKSSFTEFDQLASALTEYNAADICYMKNHMQHVDLAIMKLWKLTDIVTNYNVTPSNKATISRP